MVPEDDAEVSRDELGLPDYRSLFGQCWRLFVGAVFRAWFSFPLNFMSDEQLVELNERGIKKHAIKGWFASAFYMNRPYAGPDRLEWSEVRELRYDPAGSRMCPMPAVGAFNPNMLLYRVLNKMAAFIDGAVDKLGRAEFVEIAAGPNRTDARITLKLWELD